MHNSIPSEDPKLVIHKIIESLPKVERVRIRGIIEKGDSKVVHELYRDLLEMYIDPNDRREQLLTQLKMGATLEIKPVTGHFKKLANSADRRQALRWLLHDYPKPTTAVISLLKDALQDQDWEVNLTAILIAGRMGTRDLAPLIQMVEIPDGEKYGYGKRDEYLFKELKETVLKSLQSKKNVPLQSLSATHLQMLVAGEPVDNFDYAFVKVNALILPEQPTTQPKRPSIPPQLVFQDGRYFSRRSRIEFIWVPPLPHWLGSDTEEWDDLELLPNPIRQKSSDVGFWIAATPFSLHQGSGLIAPDSDSDPSGKFLICEKSTAEEICLEFSELEKMSLRLPIADEMEMAARGIDGRRMPWGNGLEVGYANLPSPWGATGLLGVVGHWTSDLDPAMNPIVSGGKGWGHAAMRCVETRAHAKWGFRFVIEKT